jgi:hypothetical protein
MFDFPLNPIDYLHRYDAYDYRASEFSSSFTNLNLIDREEPVEWDDQEE